MTDKEVIVNSDLNFTVVATKNTHWVDFSIYEISGIYEVDGVDVPSYGNDDITDVNDPSIKPEIEGSVKWDGCSNWVMGRHCMHHCCSREQLENISKILTFCYDYTVKAIPFHLDKET